jgi:histidinol dehydrogenase
MGNLMETIVSILAIIGLVSIVNHMFGGEEGCFLCRIFKINREDIKQTGEKASQQMKENVTGTGEKATQQIKENVTKASESVSEKIKEKVKQAADNVSQKMSGKTEEQETEKQETGKQGTRYGSNPIRY